MTESFKQMLVEIGMTEADWEKHRAESELRMKEFIKTLRMAQKQSSTKKIRFEK